MEFNIFHLDDTLNVIPVRKLSCGEHIIGRGPLLGCNDKEVSRNHAVIAVSDDVSTITSTHQNPCFYQDRESNTVQIVSEGKAKPLKNGDKFGLLPHKYWFKIRLIKKETSTDNYTDNNVNISNMMEDDDSTSNGNSISAITHILEKSAVGNCESLTDENNLDILTEFNENQNLINNYQIYNEQGSSQQDDTLNIEQTDNTNQSAAHEELNINTENEIIDLPGDLGVPSTSNINKRKFRDRCKYGDKCYRKNPSHKREFKHPGDSDYDSDPNDDRPFCPYGTACYRKNKLHREQYNHTKSPSSSEKQLRKRPKTTKVNDELEVDDYDYDDPFIDDSEDEYKEESWSEESYSDWDKDDNEDDMKTLKKEAKRFTNKRKKD